jgi:pseudaminic acid cytidylyltransferase
MSSNICIIPARGGSKRIPRKNIKLFHGKPIIAYSIEVALKSGLFDEVMVSTDDAEIAEVAKLYGANVPFMRSKENSDDYATTAAVLIEVFEQYKLLFNRAFTIGCCIYPTNPLLSEKFLIEAFHKMEANDFDSIISAVVSSKVAWRSMVVNNGLVTNLYPEYNLVRTQDLPLALVDSSMFYIFNPEKVNLNKAIVSEKSGFILLDDKIVQDIDTEADWELAEVKYQHFLKSK